jgi:hypothetical protein
MEDVALDRKRPVEAMFDAMDNFLSLRAVANDRDEDSEFVTPDSGESVVRTKLALHSEGHLLKIEVSDLVTVNVVDLLETIQVNVDQAEDAGILASLINNRIETLVE